MFSGPHAAWLPLFPCLRQQIVGRQQRDLNRVGLDASGMQQTSPDLQVPEFVVGIDRAAVGVERQRVAPAPILDRHDVVDEFLAQLATPALLLRGLGRLRFVRPWKRSPAVQERRPRLWLRHGYGVRRYGYGVHRGYAYRRGYAYHHGYRRW